MAGRSAARGGPVPAIRSLHRTSVTFAEVLEQPLIGVLETGALSLLLEEADATPGPSSTLPFPGGQHGTLPAASSPQVTA